ncbi:MAG: glycoside hydrolase family 25 protein [Clostridium sp.]|jgi:GH25 family lysozyme M1 (1,4-beta-N-acetylmuramidase)|uniref:glycoside hydrolase family 25 protein n=1 Tax=Clostridium sp. TaxID=1506 RepID=UPI0025B8AE3B|nr:glycoside hydrolase family 25 protein [Clostridium sp.]MCH3963021.1 glycoside hydrolase family 25 protein [Clostridium sp.]MCI1871398.1 glycoside hydrolase family 25 protein [Clostridium sp.]MCI2202949.1 glycoside hydrolase family 25 protein [Clostridium sp.]
MIKGVDISNLNGNVNMNILKNAGYQFVFIRATEGTSGAGSRDEKYHTNIANAKKAGLLTGAYHFSHSCTKAKELTEIANFLDFIKGTNPDIVILDAENSCTGDMTDLCIDFLDKASAVAQPLFYANPSWIKAHLNSKITKFPLWVANYGVSKPSFTLWPYFTAWQHTDKGQISGISGYVDLNYMDDNFFSVVKNKTTNVAPKVTSAIKKYDTSIPEGDNIFRVPGTKAYIEQTTDGRIAIHLDRGNYVAIGQGFIDAYWNDNKGKSGHKRLSN